MFHQFPFDMTQQTQILQLLNDGEPHCVGEILEKMFIVDYRRRLCDLKDQGYNLISEPCGGRCGRNHSAQLHQWTLLSSRPKYENSLYTPSTAFQSKLI